MSEIDQGRQNSLLGESYKPTPAEASPSTEFADWMRENRLIERTNMNISQRFSVAPYLGDPVPSPERGITEAKRLLTVSDSFGAGWGLSDLQQTWPYRLESLLNDGTHRDAYRISRIAMGGRSMISYSKWLTRETIEAYDPDLVIISFFVNDSLITDWEEVGQGEKSLCESKPVEEKRTGQQESGTCDQRLGYVMQTYAACIEGNVGVQGAMVRTLLKPWFPAVTNWLLNRYCDINSRASQAGQPSRLDITTNPALNPNLPEFVRAAESIVSNAGTVPVLVVPILGGEGSSSYQDLAKYLDILRDTGMEVLDRQDMAAVDELLRSTPFDELKANLTDHHHGSRLTTETARAALKRVMELAPAPPATMTQSVGGSQVLDGFLPYAMVVEDQGMGRARVGLRSPKSIGESWIGSQVTIRNGSVVTDTAPCAAVGRVHARLTINDYAARAKKVNITLRATQKPLSWTTTGHDENRQERFGVFTGLGENQTYSFDYSELRSGIVVAVQEAGCAQDRAWEMPMFILDIELVDQG
jgi:hypothetical protein